MSSASKRPPETEGLSAEFYALAAQGKLHVQRCKACGVHRHPPRFMCAECGSAQWEWAPVNGTGEVFSWTVTHKALDPGWAPEAPYATLVVELDEGARLIGGLRGLAPDDLHFGMRVRAELEPAGERAALIYFVPNNS